MTRGDALGSHCPTEPQTGLPRTTSERKRLNKSPRRRRRNTLPSLILTEQEAQILAGPRDDMVNQSWRQAEPMPTKFKRRSRSADALNEMVVGHDLRDHSPDDRESQIKYWRNSVVENPAPSYIGWPMEDDAQLESSRNHPELAPIQTFDFGLEKPGVEPATLEERVNTLEVKVFDFEYAIARLQGHDIPKPLLHPKPPKRRSIHELFPTNCEDQVVLQSPLPEPTSFLRSPEESPMPSSDHEEHFGPDRSSKATTVRPLTARRSPRAHSPSPLSHLTTSQFDQLMEIIRQEQSARRQLEQRVADLQKELTALRTPVYAEIRPMSYPTPSPESVDETPVAPRHLHRSPRFQAQTTPQAQTFETSRFSMSDSIDTETDTEDGFQDVYETPQENRHTFETTRGSPLIGVF